MSDNVKKVLDFCNSFDWGNQQFWLDTFISDIAYEGFDAVAIIDMIVRKPGWENDIPRLLVMSMERGNNVVRILDGMNSDKRSEVSQLIQKYGIVYRKDMTNNPRTSVTLSRLMICFSWLAVKYTMLIRNPVVGSPLIDHFCIPRALICPAFSNLIPIGLSGPNEDTIERILARAHGVHQYYFSKTLTGNTSKFDRIGHCERVAQYIELGITNSLVPMESRIKTCQTMGLIFAQENGGYTTSLEIQHLSKFFLYLCSVNGSDDICNYEKPDKVGFPFDNEANSKESPKFSNTALKYKSRANKTNQS